MRTGKKIAISLIKTILVLNAFLMIGETCLYLSDDQFAYEEILQTNETEENQESDEQVDKEKFYWASNVLNGQVIMSKQKLPIYDQHSMYFRSTDVLTPPPKNT